jgi:hypothetical protein
MEEINEKWIHIAHDLLHACEEPDSLLQFKKELLWIDYDCKSMISIHFRAKADDQRSQIKITQLKQHVAQSILFGEQYDKLRLSKGPFTEKFSEMYSTPDLDPALEAEPRASLMASYVKPYHNNTMLYQGGGGAGTGGGASYGADPAIQALNIMPEVDYFKKVTALIESHLSNEKHAFCQAIHRFKDYIADTYEEPIMSVSSGGKGDRLQGDTGNDAKQAREIVPAMIEDVQQFIALMYEAINGFYCLSALNEDEGEDAKVNVGEYILSRDNLMNFIASIIFDDAFYAIVFNGFKSLYQDDEQTLREAFFDLRKQPIEFYGVAEPFTLSKHGQSIIETTIDKTSPKSDDLMAGEFTPVDAKIERRSQPPSPQLSKKGSMTLNQPYYEAFEYLKAIQMMRSPLHKLKAILKTAELINNAINGHLAGWEKKPELDSDQLFTILVYILVHSGVANMKAHLQFIESFTTSNIMTCISGYYCSAFDAAVQYCHDLLAKEKAKDKHNGNGKAHLLISMGNP